MRRPSMLLVCCLLGTACLVAAEADSASTGTEPSLLASAEAMLDDDPAGLLGLGLDEAIARFGAPDSVGSVRGDEPWQDDVAFVYKSGFTLFWYSNRLWQLRFAEPYSGSLYGLFIGDGSDKVLSVLGPPFDAGGDYLVYRMPYRSYPVKLKIILKDDRVIDAYLYRADF